MRRTRSQSDSPEQHERRCGRSTSDGSVQTKFAAIAMGSRTWSGTIIGGVSLVLILGAVGSIARRWPGDRLGRDDLIVTATPSQPSTRDPWGEDILPILKIRCGGCHSGDEAQGAFSLADHLDQSSIQQHRAVWERAATLLLTGGMPPSGAPQPTVAERETLLAYLEVTLFSDEITAADRPDGVTLRRLNRLEYDNTVRDLLGVEFQPSAEFPSDDVGEGFDNNGEFLSLSPLLMEKYLIAAEKIAELAVADRDHLAPSTPDTRPTVFNHHPRDGQSPIDAVHENLRRFLPKAFRRPVDEEELEVFVTLAEQVLEAGESFEFAMQTALTAVLVSPHFLLRVEGEPSFHDTPEVPNSRDHELAARLSYFLWSSLPDDELVQQANAGVLRSDAVLETQVRRMLTDPKLSGLTDGFAAQWLRLRLWDDVRPNPEQFPEFDADLRADLLQETKLFFEDLVRHDRSILNFLDGPYAFVNDRLATHYGLPGIAGPEFRRVSLEGTGRAGLLTQGSILTLTSIPTRTSPVKRGKWILETILDQPPAPPPPDIPSLAASSDASSEMTVRQRLESHRANPNCASCHQTMDAMGFGLEQFDPIGRWRETDGSQPVDASGVLPDGTTFRGPRELIAVLRQRETEFARCLTTKLLTYALGRRLSFADRRVVEGIVAKLKVNEFRFSVLFTEITKSRPFRGEGPTGTQ